MGLTIGGFVAAGLVLLISAYLVVRFFLPHSDSGLSVAQQLTAAFATASALGAIVALVVNIRRQHLRERFQSLEIDAAFTDRFREAARQLGAAASAERIAGVYAMAALTDDYPERAQQCVDVLCGYLRLPYDPAIDHLDTRTTDRVVAQGVTVHETDATRPNDTEVRYTIAATIRGRTQNATDRWVNLSYDFTGARLHNLNLNGSHFSGDRLVFDEAIFSGDHATFVGVSFGGRLVSFRYASISTDTLTFEKSVFSCIDLSFEHAIFLSAKQGSIGDRLPFPGVTSFTGVRFCGIEVSFKAAKLLAAHTTFENTSFTCQNVLFEAAAFCADKLSFKQAVFSGAQANFENARFTGQEVFFDAAVFSAERVSFKGATFSASVVSCIKVLDSRADIRSVEIWDNIGRPNFLYGAELLSGTKCRLLEQIELPNPPVW